MGEKLRPVSLLKGSRVLRQYVRARAWAFSTIYREQLLGHPEPTARNIGTISRRHKPIGARPRDRRRTYRHATTLAQWKNPSLDPCLRFGHCDGGRTAPAAATVFNRVTPGFWGQRRSIYCVAGTTAQAQSRKADEPASSSGHGITSGSARLSGSETFIRPRIGSVSIASYGGFHVD
jgi:hypothetical protein